MQSSCSNHSSHTTKTRFTNQSFIRCGKPRYKYIFLKYFDDSDDCSMHKVQGSKTILWPEKPKKEGKIYNVAPIGMKKPKEESVILSAWTTETTSVVHRLWRRLCDISGHTFLHRLYTNNNKCSEKYSEKFPKKIATCRDSNPGEFASAADDLTTSPFYCVHELHIYMV